MAFITFEGGEGSGKSTQMTLFMEFLKSRGVDAIATREPGGAPGAEAIRQLLVAGEPGRWDAMTETLLHTAARRDHLTRVIVPALNSGQWVVSDRFADSTAAYQGHGHGVDLALIDGLYRIVASELKPDLTLILDLDLDRGLERAAGRAEAAGENEDRYEKMDRAFHERLRQGFLAIAAAEPARCKMIDAAGSEAEVQARIIAAAKAQFLDDLS